MYFYINSACVYVYRYAYSTHLKKKNVSKKIEYIKRDYAPNE